MKIVVYFDNNGSNKYIEEVGNELSDYICGYLMGLSISRFIHYIDLDERAYTIELRNPLIDYEIEEFNSFVFNCHYVTNINIY